MLGVNGHALVLKYGLDFQEYRDVIAMAEEMPEVAAAAPFVIDEMMLANGHRIGGVLVKGVDPEAMPRVLDLPDQMIEGSLRGLRLPNSTPPTGRERSGGRRSDLDLDSYLEELAAEFPDDPEPETAPVDPAEMERLRQQAASNEPLDVSGEPIEPAAPSPRPERSPRAPA